MDGNDVPNIPAPSSAFTYPHSFPAPQHHYNMAMPPSNFYGHSQYPYVYPWNYGHPQHLISLMPWWFIAFLTGCLAFLILWESNPSWVQHTDSTEQGPFQTNGCNKPNLTKIAIISSSIALLVMLISFVSLYCIRSSQENKIHKESLMHMYTR
jgi:hypothetical protein